MQELRYAEIELIFGALKKTQPPDLSERCSNGTRPQLKITYDDMQLEVLLLDSNGTECSVRSEEPKNMRWSIDDWEDLNVYRSTRLKIGAIHDNVKEDVHYSTITVRRGQWTSAPTPTSNVRRRLC